MLYKTKDKIFGNSLHFRCQCGGEEFFDVCWVEDYYGKDKEFEVCFVQCPKGFWHRLRWLFSQEYYTKVIILSQKDVKELKKFLDREFK